MFVRKRIVEVQYLKATISDAQREEFGLLVEDTIRRIEAGHFLPRSGTRSPEPLYDLPIFGVVPWSSGSGRPHFDSPT